MTYRTDAALETLSFPQEDDPSTVPTQVQSQVPLLAVQVQACEPEQLHLHFPEEHVAESANRGG